MTRIETHGRQVEQFITIIESIAEEAVLQPTCDGLRCEVVDSGNIATVDVTLPEATMEAYDPAEDAIGVVLDPLSSATSYARVGRGNGDNGDSVVLELDETMCRVKVKRLDGDEPVGRRESVWFNPDADSLRDRPDVPEKGQDAKAAISDASVFTDAVDNLSGTAEDVWLTTGDGEREEGGKVLRLAAGSSKHDATAGDVFTLDAAGVDFDGDEEAAAEGSLVSMDYMSDIADALDAAWMDRCTVRWSEGFPIEINFTCTGTGVHGTFRVAPRIPDGDGVQQALEHIED